MLSFLSDIFGKKKRIVEKAAPQPKKEKAPVPQDEKIEALKAAEQIPDDDAVIKAFLMQCRFADARYAAAQRLRSKEAMEEVRTAMQKTDRRVYRLMQSRLAEISRNDALIARIEGLAGKAEELLGRTVLAPNQVADLDRDWKGATEKSGDIPQEYTARYTVIRAKLESRLTGQMALQREIRTGLDELASLRKNAEVSIDARRTVLQKNAAALQIWKASPEIASVPRQLLGDFEAALTELTVSFELLEKEAAAQQARAAWLSEKEAADKPSLNEADLKKDWAALPDVKNKEKRAELAERYQTLLASLKPAKAETAPAPAEKAPETAEAPAETAETRKKKAAPADPEAYFKEHLAGLKAAIGAGSVQEAAVHEEALRQLDAASFKPGRKEQDELAELRSEFRRLNGWAKWSGQQSREKLISLVEQLPEQELDINELADAVVRAREEWKALNSISGMSTREQWAQFDAACNRAYEPVLEHAKKQADERVKNTIHADLIIEDVRNFVQEFEGSLADAEGRKDAFDWKPAINFYRQTTQVWRQLGMVEKKEKKRLDETFAAVMLPLRERLYARTQLEIESREKLIEEAAAIDPEQKDAGRILRAIQEKWQVGAKAFPLDNRDDKKLWTRFRETCEQVHLKRMEKNRASDAERQRNLKEKENICAEIEALHAAGNAEILETGLGKFLSQWKGIGFVPRENEPELQKRLDTAVKACRALIAQMKSEKMRQALSVLGEKMKLCFDLEKQVAVYCSDSGEGAIDAASEDEKFESAWKALPFLPDKMESVLSHRFYNALKAMASRNLAYSRQLAGNVSKMKDKLLEFEIIFGLESPENLKEERRKKQIGLLQESLGGMDKQNPEDAVRTILELPALAEDEDFSRIEKLVSKLAA